MLALLFKKLCAQGMLLILGLGPLGCLCGPSVTAQSRASQTKDRKVSIARPVQAAERRVALVIGNGNYPFGSLRNPVNDATDMAKTLTNLGFEVISRTDVTQREMLDMLSAFGKKLQNGDVGLFYFAGHGVQVRGENYLIPVDAGIQTDADVDLYCLDLNKVLNQMKAAGNPLNIVILDACRNNPFITRTLRNTQQGLAEVKGASGMFLAFATGPGETASDGTGRNGLYTQELLEALNQPGLPIEQTFKTVLRQVKQRSNGQQLPYAVNLLESDFYFVPEPAVPEALPEKPAVAIPSAAAIEEQAWNETKDSTRPGDFEAFLAEFPNGSYARLARLKLKKLNLDKEPPRTASTATPLKDNPAAKPAPPPVEKSAKTSSDSPATAKDKDRSNPKTVKPDLPSRPARLGILTLTTNVVDSKFTLTNTGTKLPGPSGAFINLNQLTQDLNVLPGQYLVTILHPDFEPFSQQVEIVAGGKVALNAVLQPHPVAPSHPGNSKDTTTLKTSPPADTTSIEPSRPYLSRRRTAAPSVEMGALALTVPVDGAVYNITSATTGKKILNGNFLKSGELTQQLALEPGLYMVEVRHPEYSVFYKKVQIKPRGQFLLTAKLEPLAASTKKTKKTNQSVIDRGMNKLIQGDYDGAIKDMYQAREVNPALKSQLNEALAQAYFQRGLAKKDRQDFSGASEDVKASIALNPNRPVVHLTLANLLAGQGNLASAIESGQRAAELDPMNPECQEALLLWYQQLGVKQKENNQFDLAEHSFLAATRLSPRYASVYNHLGECQTQLGKQQEAEVNLREAVRLDPGNARYLRNLGAHLVNQAKFAEAIPFLKDCVRIEQGDGKTYYFLGVAHARNGELQFAEEALKAAIHLKNNEAAWHFALGLIFEKQFKKSEALREVSQAIALDPTNLDYLEAKNRLSLFEKPRLNSAMDVQILDLRWDYQDSNSFVCEVQINRPAGTKVEAKFFAIQTGQIEKTTEIASTKITQKKNNEKTILSFRILASILRRKTSQYQIIVYLNDKPAMVIPFKIEGSTIFPNN